MDARPLGERNKSGVQKINPSRVLTWPIQTWISRFRDGTVLFPGVGGILGGESDLAKGSSCNFLLEWDLGDLSTSVRLPRRVEALSTLKVVTPLYNTPGPPITTPSAIPRHVGSNPAFRVTIMPHICHYYAKRHTYATKSGRILTSLS
jgi:hypothetical protein